METGSNEGTLRPGYPETHALPPDQPSRNPYLGFRTLPLVTHSSKKVGGWSRNSIKSAVESQDAQRIFLEPNHRR